MNHLTDKQTDYADAWSLAGQKRNCATVKSTAERQAEKSEDVTPVIILNWNGEDDTIECLKSIKRSVPAGFAPVLVDNRSNPASVERLKHECGLIFSRIVFLKESELSALGSTRRAEFRQYLGEDSLVFIENAENLGFAKGNNVGIRYAEFSGAEWVMLLNNDTVVSPEAFEELRKFQKAYPSFAAITPQIRHQTPSTRVQNCGGELTYFGSRRYKFANMDSSVVPESGFSVITFVTGCALLFKYKVTGPLTEDFFFGEEDYEFSLRMKKLRLEMACAHRAVVYHKGRASISTCSRPMGSILVQYVSRLIDTRNYYSAIRWHATRILAYLYLPVLFATNGIDPRKTIAVIRCTEAYLRGHRDVDRAEYESIIMRES